MQLLNLNNISFGLFIDLETLISKSDNQLEVCKYLYEFNDGESIDNLTYNDVMLGIKTYIEFRTGIYKNYEGLFDGGDGDEDPNDKMLSKYGIKNEFDFEEEKKLSEEEKEWQKQFAWMRVADSLAGGDFLRINEVFNRPLIAVLNYLVFKSH